MVSAVTTSSSSAAVQALLTLKQSQAAQKAQDLFKKVDTDGSGGLSLDEFTAGLTRADGTSALPANGTSAQDLFAQIDTNSDGSVSQDELAAQAQKKLSNIQQNGLSSDLIAQFISKIDTDGDGQISEEEFSAAAPKDKPADAPSSSDIFAQNDTDGDGELSSDEVATLLSNGPPGGPHGGHGPHGAGGPPPGGPPSDSSDDSDDDDSLSAIEQLLADLQEQATTVQADEKTASDKAALNLEQRLSETLKYLISNQNGGNQTLSAA